MKDIIIRKDGNGKMRHYVSFTRDGFQWNAIRPRDVDQARRLAAVLIEIADEEEAQPPQGFVTH